MLNKLNCISNIILLIAIIYLLFALNQIRDIRLRDSALISNLIAQCQSNKINSTSIGEINNIKTDNFAPNHVTKEIRVKIKNLEKKYSNFSATTIDSVVISSGKTELTKLSNSFRTDPTRGHTFLLIENPTDLIEVENPSMVKSCIMRSMVQSVNNHILFTPEELLCLIADKSINFKIEQEVNEDNLFQAELISAQEMSKTLESSQNFKKITDQAMHNYTKEILSVESLSIPKGTKIQGKIPKLSANNKHEKE